jgi:hypothetical protein
MQPMHRNRNPVYLARSLLNHVFQQAGSRLLRYNHDQCIIRHLTRRTMDIQCMSPGLGRLLRPKTHQSTALVFGARVFGCIAVDSIWLRAHEMFIRIICIRCVS